MELNTRKKASDTWTVKEAEMSFFRKPITNKKPEKESVDLFWVYQYLRSHEAMPETKELRAISDKTEQRVYKGKKLDYITPSGTFTYCNDAGLIKHSHLLCVDLDELEDVEPMKQKLLSDPMFETLLLFRSPRGNGLKWFIQIDLTKCDHRQWFTAVRNYLMATYHLTEEQVDPQCINVSRACYLCYDPDAYLKTELIEHF